MFNFIQTAFAQQQLAINAAKDQTEPALGGITELISTIITRFPLWIAAAIVFTITIIIAKLIKSSATRALIKAKGEDVHEGNIILVGRVTYVAVVSIGLVISLQIAGIDLGWLLGAIGLGIGFSTKDLINNFLSGVIILLQNEVSIGDCICSGDIKGTVIDIQPRATIVQAFDGTKVTIPNGKLLSKEFICYTANPFRRIAIEIGVDFTTDLDKAKEIILEVLKKHEKIVPKPAPSVLTTKFGDSALMLSARFWVNSRGGWLGCRSDIIRDIKKAFDQNEITIPFPIHTVYGNEEHPIAFDKAMHTPATVPVPAVNPGAEQA